MEKARITVMSAGRKGRGVFACHRIPSYLYIETAPANIIKREDRARLKGLGELGEYPFVNRNEWKELPDHQKHLCSGFVVWGLMSIVNHAMDTDKANVRVDLIKRADSYYGVMVAIRDIKAGEELLLDYPDVEDYDTEGWTDTATGVVDDGAGVVTQFPGVQVLERPGVTRLSFKKLHNVCEDERR